jgi:8-oxo-dGTP diphosphatase
MSASEQGAGLDRYVVVPRTAIFLRQGESYLLMKGAATKRLWAGKYNALGGHVERGEDVLSAALRELSEEAGLEADLWLCGVVVVDAGETGVCLFVFSGQNRGGVLRPSLEGTPEWISYQDVGGLPVVEDLPVLLERIHGMRRGDLPFSARSFYDGDQHLRLQFVD